MSPTDQPKIDRLTDEQEAELVRWRDRWLAIGCSTEPADRLAAEAAITKLYQNAGEQTPKFIWCLSPQDAVNAITKAYQESDGLEADKARQAALSAGRFWGQTEASWPCFYLFCRDVLGIKYDEPHNSNLDLWAQVSRSCNWWWPFEGLCFVSDRPELVSWEPSTTAQRLHSLTGPAIRFRDGWEIYAIKGITVDKRVVMTPELLEPWEITDEPNTEIRRIMLERYGFDRYLAAVKATCLDSDTDPLGFPRKLLRADLSGDESLVMVQVTNSTAEPDGSHKLYHLRVPPTVTTVKQALAWTFGLSVDQYNPGKET